MSRRRSHKPETVPFDGLAEIVGGTLPWHAAWASAPKTARVWRRHDGGVTIRVLGRSTDGMALSVTLKLRPAG